MANRRQSLGFLALGFVAVFAIAFVLVWGAETFSTISGVHCSGPDMIHGAYSGTEDARSPNHDMECWCDSSSYVNCILNTGSNTISGQSFNQEKPSSALGDGSGEGPFSGCGVSSASELEVGKSCICKKSDPDRSGTTMPSADEWCVAVVVDVAHPLDSYLIDPHDSGQDYAEKFAGAKAVPKCWCPTASGCVKTATSDCRWQPSNPGSYLDCSTYTDFDTETECPLLKCYCARGTCSTATGGCLWQNTPPAGSYEYCSGRPSSSSCPTGAATATCPCPTDCSGTTDGSKRTATNNYCVASSTTVTSGGSWVPTVPATSPPFDRSFSCTSVTQCTVAAATGATCPCTAAKPATGSICCLTTNGGSTGNWGSTACTGSGSSWNPTATQTADCTAIVAGGTPTDPTGAAAAQAALKSNCHCPSPSTGAVCGCSSAVPSEQTPSTCGWFATAAAAATAGKGNSPAADCLVATTGNCPLPATGAFCYCQGACSLSNPNCAWANTTPTVGGTWNICPGAIPATCPAGCASTMMTQMATGATGNSFTTSALQDFLGEPTLCKDNAPCKQLASNPPAGPCTVGPTYTPAGTPAKCDAGDTPISTNLSFCKCTGDPIVPGNCAWSEETVTSPPAAASAIPTLADGQTDMTGKCIPSSGISLFYPTQPIGVPCTSPATCQTGCECCVDFGTGKIVGTPGAGPTGICAAGPGCTTNLLRCNPPQGGNGAYCSGDDGKCSGSSYSSPPGTLGGSCASVACTEGKCQTTPDGVKICLADGALSGYQSCTGAGKVCYPLSTAGSMQGAKCVYSVQGNGIVVEGKCIDQGAVDDAGKPCGQDDTSGNTKCVETVPSGLSIVPGICTSPPNCVKGTCENGGGFMRKCADWGTIPIAEQPKWKEADSTKKCPNQSEQIKCYESNDPSITQGCTTCGGTPGPGPGPGPGPVDPPYTPAGCETTDEVTRRCVAIDQIPADEKFDGVQYEEDPSLPCTLDDSCCPDRQICMRTLQCQPEGALNRTCATLEDSNTLGEQGWTESEQECADNDKCCTRAEIAAKKTICMEKMGNVAGGFTMTVKPSTADKRIKTGCTVTVNASQNNALACYTNENLTVKRAGTINMPTTKGIVQVAAKPCYWTWTVDIPADGAYNFSFFTENVLVNWTQYTALASVPITCPPANCDELCKANSSFQETRLGCGVSPCSKFQALYRKSCPQMGQCGDITVTYCKEDTTCSPLVQGSWETINLAGTQNFNVSLFANITGYAGNVMRLLFFIDGAKVGEDTGSPYEYTSGTYAAGTNHTYMAMAVTGDGNFSSVNYTIAIPGTVPLPTPIVRCPTVCNQYLECSCNVTGCGSVPGDIYIASARMGSRIERPLTGANFSFYPPFSGTHTVQIVCDEKASDAKTFEVSPTSLSLAVVSGSCGIPNKRACNLTIQSSAIVPLDMFILGNSTKGVAYSVLRRETGWSGNRTIVFSDITYKGASPHELFFVAYPRDAYKDLPGAFVRAIYVAKVTNATQ